MRGRPSHWDRQTPVDEKWLRDFIQRLKEKNQRDIELMNRSKRIYNQGRSAFTEDELMPR